MTETSSTPPGAPHEPPPHPADGSYGQGTGPRVTRDEIRDLGRLRRSSTDRHIAGVAGGLGRHLDIDPVILRVAFVVLTFFGGAGIIVYAACWLLVPEDVQPRATLALDPRSRTVALIGVGVLAALAVVGNFWGGSGWFPWPLLVIGLIAWAILSSKDRSARVSLRKQEAGWAPAYGPQPQYGAPGGRPGWVAPPGSQPQYDTPGSGPGWVPPPTYAPQPFTPLPRDPRKKGPLLFWLTLPTIALGIGILGVFDLAGADVVDSAYPALALGLIAAALVLGAFWGRAGGLILLGFIATFALIGATVTEHWEGDRIEVSPNTAAAVDASYDVGAGEIVLDLTDVSDLSNLDGRTLDLSAGVGRIEVIVPDGLDVMADGTIDGPGDISLFGRHDDGIELDATGRHDGGLGAPLLRIDAEVGVGEIVMVNR